MCLLWKHSTFPWNIVKYKAVWHENTWNSNQTALKKNSNLLVVVTLNPQLNSSKVCGADDIVHQKKAEYSRKLTSKWNVGEHMPPPQQYLSTSIVGVFAIQCNKVASPGKTAPTTPGWRAWVEESWKVYGSILHIDSKLIYHKNLLQESSSFHANQMQTTRILTLSHKTRDLYHHILHIHELMNETIRQTINKTTLRPFIIKTALHLWLSLRSGGQISSWFKPSALLTEPETCPVCWTVCRKTCNFWKLMSLRVQSLR